MFTNSDMTIYNAYIDQNKNKKYKRTYVSNVFWDSIKGKSRAKYGKENADSVLVLFPLSELDDYVSSSNFEPTQNKFTIAESDIMVKGEAAEEITETFREKDLRQKYGEVFSITSVDNKLFGSPSIQHIEVRGK